MGEEVGFTRSSHNQAKARMLESSFAVFLIPKSVSSERPIALMLTMIDWRTVNKEKRYQLRKW